MAQLGERQTEVLLWSRLSEGPVFDPRKIDSTRNPNQHRRLNTE